MVEIHHKTIFNYIINIYVKFSKKKLDEVYNDSKIKLKKFQINLMLEIFMCLMLDY
jgi:hypothetical protein